MANIVVEIIPNQDIRYDPSPNVQQGDTVTFRIAGVIGEVSVSFDQTSCFVDPGPFEVNTTSLSTVNSIQQVSLTAPKGLYPFTVSLPDTASKEKRMGPRNFETKRGTIDVTTDPPKDKTK